MCATSIWQMVSRSGWLEKAAINVDEEFLAERLLRHVDAVEAMKAEIGYKDTISHWALLMA